MAEWRATPGWRLRAGWTELRVHSEPQPGSTDRGTRDSIARDPNHQVSLRSPTWFAKLIASASFAGGLFNSLSGSNRVAIVRHG